MDASVTVACGQTFLSSIPSFWRVSVTQPVGPGFVEVFAVCPKISCVTGIQAKFLGMT